LPKVVELTAIPIMFADDTSIIMASDNSLQLPSKLNMVMSRINKWFQDNLIALNLNKTYFIQFLNKTHNNQDIQIKIGNTNITTINEIMFLGLKIDKTFLERTYGLYYTKTEFSQLLHESS
jgi:hypothetical protein